MVEAVPVQQLSLVQYLLRNGLADQLPIVATGVVLILFSLVALIFPRPRSVVLTLGLLSTLPGLIGLSRIVISLQSFSKLALSPEPPKPTVFAEILGNGLGAGFWGLVMSLLPLCLCLFALANMATATAEQQPE